MDTTPSTPFCFEQDGTSYEQRLASFVGVDLNQEFADRQEACKVLFSRVPTDSAEFISLFEQMRFQCTIPTADGDTEWIGAERMLRDGIPNLTFADVVALPATTEPTEARRTIEAVILYGKLLSRPYFLDHILPMIAAHFQNHGEEWKILGWRQEEWQRLPKLYDQVQVREEEFIQKQAGAREEAASQPLPLEWQGTLTDLVIVIAALKATGLLSAATTDELIAQHFNYSGAAKNPRRSIVNTRKRIRDQEQKPRQIKDLINQLQKSLERTSC